jgi:hypothetical protein
MKPKTFTILIIAGVFLGLPAQAQLYQKDVNAEKPGFDPRMLNHYSEIELMDLQTNYPLDYNIFTYYLTQSYSLEITSCEGCNPVDPSTFDISKYEYLRKKDETVIYNDNKHGFILTIYAIQSLEYLTPQQEFMLTIND